MAFVLFLCGPSVGDLREAAPALLEELATRGCLARVLCDRGEATETVEAASGDELAAKIGAALEEKASAVVLLSEASARVRAALAGRWEEAVVVDWAAAGGFEPSEAPHLSLGAEVGPIDGLGQVFEVLEGLGFVAFAEQGALTTEQDDELVARLKDLGYV